MSYEDPKMDTSNISWPAKDSVGLQKKSMSYEIYDYKDKKYMTIKIII